MKQFSFISKICKMKTTKKLSNQGTFFQRVEENVKNGWVYPKNVIVRTMHSGGNSGNIACWYRFDGKTFASGCYVIPEWAGQNGKYTEAKKAVYSYPAEKRFSIQRFIKMRS